MSAVTSASDELSCIVHRLQCATKRKLCSRAMSDGDGMDTRRRDKYERRDRRLQAHRARTQRDASRAHHYVQQHGAGGTSCGDDGGDGSSSRAVRCATAAETLHILETGRYRCAASGEQVALSEALRVMRDGTVLYSAHYDPALPQPQPQPQPHAHAHHASGGAVESEAVTVVDDRSVQCALDDFPPLGAPVARTTTTTTIATTATDAAACTNVDTAALPAPTRLSPLTITTIEVVHETTLACARRLVRVHGRTDVAALNFASAKHPGGGFLSGAQAQEESLARASGLFASIGDARVYTMYAHNRREPHDGLYSHYAIYTPRAPVFRDDTDTLLPAADVFYCSFITAPAVNANVARRRLTTSTVNAVMAQRIDRILCIAARHRHRALVLGAYGCGVFGNDVAAVGRMFFAALHSSKFRGHFDHVAFASVSARDVHVLQQVADQQFATGASEDIE